MDFYKTIYLSVCEIANRLPVELEWDADIDITYANTRYNTVTNRYVQLEGNMYVAQMIRFDLSRFDHLKYMMMAYRTLEEDKEKYLVQCIHSIFAEQLLKIFPNVQNEEVVLFYKFYDNIYPFLVSEKNIIK